MSSKSSIYLLVTLFSLAFVLFPSTKAFTQRNHNQYGLTLDRDCHLFLGEDGDTLPLHQIDPEQHQIGYKDTNSVGFYSLPGVFSSGGYSFVRSTGNGACLYEFFNNVGFKGNSRVIGANVDKRIRLGWRARSVRITKVNNDCRIVIGDDGASQTFYGRGMRIYSVNPWNFIRYTSGNCSFKVYNEYNFQGNSKTYRTGIRNRVRVGWRIRSLEIL